jgi:hypothetical protein
MVRESFAHVLTVSLTHGQPLIAGQWGADTTRAGTRELALNRTALFAGSFPL